ncbi:hypothetical protein A3A67_00475 [Candidatus Peribacteria bacterium RIFCSPLOWO2_01_FULL_51_18]|nr:MAG: hypothetical protein A3A67_00475 [Candidatus Peribacteria bacterium RIFCSPLOWO2_01_FULL_51_18]
MRIKSLSLENMRSYDRLALSLGNARRHVFVGPNGGGKTNLIEALSFLSYGRSCLKAAPDDVLRWGADFFRIRAEGEMADSSACSLEYVWQRAPRRKCATFINDVRLPLLKFVGALKTVIFLPEDLDLFTGAPQHRRGFLDILISQTDDNYTSLRVEYDRLLRQRNALLKRISEGQAEKNEVTLWDDQLAHTAAEVQLRRIKIIGLFNVGLKTSLALLSEESDDALMVYERKTQATEASVLKKEFQTFLSGSIDIDLMLCTTTVGPHRDDWHLVLRGHPLEKFASRGQQRTCLLALLLRSADILAEVSGERPTVLLDDVLSELDDRHQEALLKALSGNQVLITSTHQVPIYRDTAVWEVNKGVVISNRQ